MKLRFGRHGAIVATLALATVIGSQVGTVAAPGTHQSDVEKDLATVRRATTVYHDVNRAEADGYVSTAECASSPAGGMGVHYVNFGLIDGRVELERPEILLYAPSGNGVRLVAVEYMVPDADQNLSTDGDRPSLFGRGFHGPMPGHGPGQPVHYDLHAWVWQANPAGVFEDWNPMVECPSE